MPTKSRRRPYRNGVPQHVYFKGLNSFGIFYELFDHLYFLTLFFCLARKYGITVLALCIMFNHAHHLSFHVSRLKLSRFQQELESTFAKEYNRSRGLMGHLFKKQFGSVPKTIGKTIATAILYILYNPKAGAIVEKAADYRWNLMSYRDCDHPFSKAIVRSQCSRRMRRALSCVDAFRSENRALKYATLAFIFRGLTADEVEQMIDYIISSYNEVDYEQQISYFGSIERMVGLLESTIPKEYDLKEDWEDYSQYEKMINATRDYLNKTKVAVESPGTKGVNGQSGTKAEMGLMSPQTMEDEEKAALARVLMRQKGSTAAQVCKFLHIKR